MRPRWLNGDLVIKRILGRHDTAFRLGLIISVKESNPKTEHMSNIHPYVYYVWFDGHFEGPLFQSELLDA